MPHSKIGNMLRFRHIENVDHDGRFGLTRPFAPSFRFLCNFDFLQDGWHFMAQKAAESMPRRMAGVKWRPRIASGGMLLRIRAVIVAFAVLWWDSGRRDPAKVEAFPVVRLHDTSQWNRLYRVTSSERTSKGGGVDYATTPLLWAASKGGAASGRGQKRSSTKSGGGFGKVATRPVTDKQQESGRGRSTASTTAGGERGEARRSQSTDGSATSPAQLDKWGLPPPTLDDIFPPLPDGTQLVPVVFNTNYTLEQMQAAVRDVVRLDLDRHFDGLGVERDSASRSQAGQHGKPMKLRLLHQSPPVLAIDNFFTPEECEATRQIVDESKTQPTSTATDSGPPTVQVSSKTFEGAISRRTSTSWFCHYRQHPVLLAKAVHLLGLELPHMEEPQIVRYQPGQEFSFHYDQVPAHQTGNGGQRLATLLYVFGALL